MSAESGTADRALEFVKKNVPAIAGAVGRVLDNPALAAGLSSAGRSAASEFRWERVASQVEDYYQQCIEEADHRGAAG